MVGTDGLCRGHRTQRQRGQELRPLKLKRSKDPMLLLHRVRGSVCTVCGPIVPHGLSRRCPNSSRQTALMAKYGLSLVEWNLLMERQAFACAICGATDRRFAVDHSHNGSCHVRGILCFNCNRGIGLLADSPELLRAAAAYLERYTETIHEGRWLRSQ
jgi:hypothetical protein